MSSREMDVLVLLGDAWSVIATVGSGDWTQETDEWREAAERFRTDYFDLLSGAVAMDFETVEAPSLEADASG